MNASPNCLWRQMASWSCLAILTSLALAAAAGAAPDQSAEDRVLLLSVEGRVDVARVGTENWAPARANQVLQPGDKLRTGKSSRATIRSSKWGQLRVRESGLIVIEAPRASGQRPLLNLLKGFFYFFNRDKAIEVDLQNRLASAATRGTEFQVAVSETGRMEVAVFDGEVDLRNDSGMVTVASGQQGVATAGQAPTRVSVPATPGVIQWCLHYPAVLVVDELGLSDEEKAALRESLAAWQSGDALAALNRYPENRQPASAAERVYRAALLLVIGETAQAEALLPNTGAAAPLADALRQTIAAVQFRDCDRSETPALTTEWLAESYCRQSRASTDPKMLERALQAAEAAAAKAPESGLAWARLAELRFSFGRTEKALSALDSALRFAPRSAQALALKGFLLSAQNKIPQAAEYFAEAIAVDGALADAWLGQGLCRIRLGRTADGQADLLTAAALEPQRALLRSYLGKAFSDVGDVNHARQELQLARKLDPLDPTSWLYAALDHERHNRINAAIRDLEKSAELNDNRSVYRSGFLLDQDRAVRSVNLARIYDEAGLGDVALREASRAVATDYGDFSSHLFLANSYEQLRRDNLFEQRYETPAFSEYLLASLMGPADGRLLAQPVTQQEYTRLFERDSLGFSSSTEYLSRGAWDQYAAQYGTLRNSSYALEGDYRWDPGETANRNVESYLLSAKFKQMLSPHDGLLFQILDFWQSSGDLAQRYDPNDAIAGLHVREKQEPSLLVGLDHQWSESQRTLVLASHFNDSLTVANPHGSTLLLTETGGELDGFFPSDLTQQFESRLGITSFELQHLVQSEHFRTIVGIRYQFGTDHLSNQQIMNVGNSPNYELYYGDPGTVVADQSFQVQMEHLSPYVYESWQIAKPLWLIGGLSYDYLSQPDNSLFAPLADTHTVHRQLSPKAALVWTPLPRSTVRAAYSQSLSGVDLDQSVRLEPTQLAGFVQTYRNLFPNSLVGGVGGAHVETADVALDYRFPTGTYVALAGEWLRSKADHRVGAFQRELGVYDGPTVQLEERLRFQERSLDFSAHQLLADWFSVGVRYRLAEAQLTQTYPRVDPAIGPLDPMDLTPIGPTSRGLLHQVALSGLFQHTSGFFAGIEASWWSQHLEENLAGTPGDSFWQVNLQAGFRFPHRRAEITFGVLNLAGQDYRLYPINLYPDLPRERTFFMRLQLNF